MSLQLPSHIALPTGPARIHLAIATIVLYAAILIPHVPLRIVQESRYWSHRQPRSAWRAAFKGVWNFVNIVCVLRITANALYLSQKNPDKGTAVAIVALQGVGIVPLVFYLSVVLIKSGEAGLADRRTTVLPKPLVYAIYAGRGLLIVGAILIIVAACTLLLALFRAGAIVVLLGLIYIILLHVFMTFLAPSRLGFRMHERGMRALRVALAALPFCVPRIVYLCMVEWGPEKYNPVFGQIGYQIVLGLLAELGIIAPLVVAVCIVEPVGRKGQKRVLAEDDEDVRAHAGEEE